jgi:hypothetical protein
MILTLNVLYIYVYFIQDHQFVLAKLVPSIEFTLIQQPIKGEPMHIQNSFIVFQECPLCLLRSGTI